MPELPEVETVRRGLIARIEGRRFARVEARRPDLRVPLPTDFAARVQGRRLSRIARRAKYLLLHLDDGQVLFIHLGMSGRLVLHARGHNEPPGKHEHVVFVMDDGTEVRFDDHRRFGLMALTTEAELPSHPFLRALGPEPLDEAFDGAVLAAALKGKRTPLKAALLDQGVVAGLGNIYVSEALFRAGLSPRRLAGTVKGPRAEKLVGAIRAVLADAIAAGGSSLRDYVQASGELGYFQHRWAVYDREGKNCSTKGCEGRIRRVVQSNRSTFYCPRCQR